MSNKTAVTFADLAGLRWKCKDCDAWHTGPCLDFQYNAPDYWRPNRECLLSPDYCMIQDREFFVRGVIHLPIVGSTETFRWGVWGSLSRNHFKQVLTMHDDPECVKLSAMFSWLSNRIEEYPDTLNLKMHVHIQKPPSRPLFRLQPSSHPLSEEQQHGITAERVKEIMLGRVLNA
jgi:hypothetical protein